MLHKPAWYRPRLILTPEILIVSTYLPAGCWTLSQLFHLARNYNNSKFSYDYTALVYYIIIVNYVTRYRHIICLTIVDSTGQVEELIVTYLLWVIPQIY